MSWNPDEDGYRGIRRLMGLLWFDWMGETDTGRPMQKSFEMDEETARQMIEDLENALEES